VDLKLNLGELKTPQDILKLTSTISILADELDTIITTSAPNGSISAREGRRCLYKNGANYEVWVNVDGGTVWQQIDAGISIPLTYIDTDGALAANSDVKVASQKATKTYVDTKVPVPLTTAKGGTGSTANANAANGAVILGADGKIPILDGSQLTGIPVLSNVIFEWYGIDTIDTASNPDGGEITSASLADNTTVALYRYIRIEQSTYRTILTGRFKKIAGISTITIQAKLWSTSTDADKEAVLLVDVGGQSNTVKTITSITPTWVTSADIDVSSLTNGTVYDITIQLKSEYSTGSWVNCSAVVLIAS